MGGRDNGCLFVPSTKPGTTGIYTKFECGLVDNLVIFHFEHVQNVVVADAWQTPQMRARRQDDAKRENDARFVAIMSPITDEWQLQSWYLPSCIAINAAVLWATGVFGKGSWLW